ncbi:hypothetical protein MIND_00364700 [Mycena indigotica]|uniref:Alcohol acetyltransferase n=1 Tax=Mycena indigotica TaxID=2126181 RepID=A0A8H6WEX6_9AGAR|nr:uncharacterized protein MIND_00364700 [Mycena indigotica]KAF7309924.1 hypothetical protein MIND_00364700 [Mycena indigotica]
MASSTTLRSAGLLECFHIVRHHLSLDSCVVVAAKYASLDGRSLSQETLFAALKTVVEKHPSLCLKVQQEDAKPSYAKLDKVDLSLVVQFSDAEDVELAIQRQLSTRFDTSAELPLWRLQVLANNTVVFAYHHGIGDGLSGVAFHMTLLDAVKVMTPNESLQTIVEIPKSIALPLPLEKVTNLRPSIFKILAEILGLFLPVSWTRLGSAWTGNPVPAAKPNLEPRVKLITLTSSEMNTFSQVCRSHKATVTSALYVLAATTISRLIPPSSEKYTKLVAAVAISLRGPANASADLMCDYVTAHKSYPLIDTVFDWSKATSYATELQRQRLVSRQEVGMLSLLSGNYIGFFNSQLGRKRGSTFEISNAGRIASSEGQWRIEDMVFAQCNVILGSALTMSVVGDPTGAMTIALTWSETAVDDMLAEAYATEFVDGFRALLV